MSEREGYRWQSYSNLLTGEISVYFNRVLLRQDMTNEIWETVSSSLSVKPSYANEWISEDLDLDDDEVTITVTTKKGKKIEFTKKLEIYSVTDEELREWDKTHSQPYVSRSRHPPADEVGGNTGVLR